MDEVDNSIKQPSDNWCYLAERRLFTKLIDHKPAGISKRFQMACLVQEMSEVAEDEDDGDFEDFLSYGDYESLLRRKQTVAEKTPESPTKKQRPRNFQPVYNIRPTSEMLWAKLSELYDLDRIDENEYFPEELLRISEFFLPDGDFSQLLRVKEEETHLASSVTPHSDNPRSTTRTHRRRRDSGETVSSRSSTPNWKDTRRS